MSVPATTALGATPPLAATSLGRGAGALRLATGVGGGLSPHVPSGEESEDSDGEREAEDSYRVENEVRTPPSTLGVFGAGAGAGGAIPETSGRGGLSPSGTTPGSHTATTTRIFAGGLGRPSSSSTSWTASLTPERFEDYAKRLGRRDLVKGIAIIVNDLDAKTITYMEHKRSSSEENVSFTYNSISYKINSTENKLKYSIDDNEVDTTTLGALVKLHKQLTTSAARS